VNAIYKDSPSGGDVHVDGPMGRGKKLPASPDFGDMGPGRPLKDVIDEIKASNRTVGEIETSLAKALEQTLYVSRKVLNADDIIKWAKAQGFETTYPAEEMHVTVAFSRSPVDWMQVGQACYSIDGKADLTVPEGGPRQVEIFGLQQNCAVLLFASSELEWRHKWIVECGASWDWPAYTPHITISQSLPAGFDPTKIEPYQGKIVLGPELFAPVKENAMDGMMEKGFQTFFKVSGVDEELGLVFGWGIVCKEDGVDYYDVQKNHIPEDAMVEATTDFMKSARVHGDMHERGTGPDMPAGMVVHSFPLTTDIAKAMGIDTKKTGWMVATAPDKAMLAKFKSGEYQGFSIGGEYIEIDGRRVNGS
jgi:hypothetical protein